MLLGVLTVRWSVLRVRLVARGCLCRLVVIEDQFTGHKFITAANNPMITTCTSGLKYPNASTSSAGHASIGGTVCPPNIVINRYNSLASGSVPGLW